ncbi:FMN reductase [Methylobacterium sp. Leaf456]|uniref:flavin reductase n=1 Tax=Methylobacterium sp. Leaf456 TaxID=1736382 RepID=UPI0006F49401|nr:flavin reductase [Methylobacterium sp. Leaf456]KQT57295.1 FMN reductase [Methylobacterium sp. Leaf456]
MPLADPAVDAPAYREAMARIASAVHLVTTDGPGGRAGFTATAVCSVSDSPPTLLVCLNRSASAYPAFQANDALCINTLSSELRSVAEAFGGALPRSERFGAARWEELATGAPTLPGALAVFDCRITERSTVGTHEILLCEVVALALRPEEAGPGASLLYAARRYRTLPMDETASD